MAGQHIRTYGSWRRPRPLGIGPFGLIGSLLAVAGLFAAFVATTMAGLAAGAGCLLLVAVVLAPLAWRGADGRTGYTQLGAVLSFRRNRRLRRHAYLPGLLGAKHAPLHEYPSRLPGLLASSRLLELTDRLGHQVAVVALPHAQQYAVLLGCNPEAGSLVDPDTVDVWVARWGAFLADLGHEPHLVGLSVTVETAPDDGRGLAAEVQRLTRRGAPQLAQEVLAEAAYTWPTGSAAVSTWVTLTFARFASTVGKGLPEPQLLAQIGDRLPGVCAALQDTGCGDVSPLSAAQVADLVAAAYSPNVWAGQQADAEQDPPVPSWQDCGPSGMVPGWDCLRHDGAWSTVWRMTAAPASPVPATILAPLLGAHPQLARKRVTLVYRPHDPQVAAAIADRDVRTAKMRAHTRSGEVRATESLSVRMARQTAEEQAGGAGLVRFALLVTVTVTDRQDLATAGQVLTQLAATSRIRLRPAAGTQAGSFAAGLGIGLVLQSQVRLPALVREQL